MSRSSVGEEVYGRLHELDCRLWRMHGRIIGGMGDMDGKASNDAIGENAFLCIFFYVCDAQI